MLNFWIYVAVHEEADKWHFQSLNFDVQRKLAPNFIMLKLAYRVEIAQFDIYDMIVSYKYWNAVIITGGAWLSLLHKASKKEQVGMTSLCENPQEISP